MASSNRHWPSMFKSKPCNPHHQWQHDINSSLMSRTPFSSGSYCDERSPEPKPRWNPKPEQIRILEAIFNSGMVNPPREEIRKIRLQLQEYGQVGDANVFYWFQNRKSRSKHKLRHLQNSKNPNLEAQQNAASLPQITAPSSSSSSSEKSSSKEMIYPTKGFSIGFSNVNDVVPNSPTASVNQNYIQSHLHNDTNLLPPTPEPFSFPLHHNGQGAMLNAMATTQGFCFSEFNSMIQPQYQQNFGPCTSLLLNEMVNHGNTSKKDHDQDKAMKIMHQHPQLGFCLTSAPTTSDVPPISNIPINAIPSPITQLQGTGRSKCTVFINDIAFEVEVGPFNVRQAFGEEAVLIHSSGQPVLTDDWGVTLQSLQHGAYYYLI
ncbi:WUSCHEL-related homeobox 9 [Abrus precatorius]|uniref:WUSCHEL-related homeobox 9 n=1 Tax=Abrus precatorius TaxID=3816 RepID=A0A8B8KY95_ABRPR|nr:WUSCHEL-related homeobox 9 [Abrus precatorius]